MFSITWSKKRKGSFLGPSSSSSSSSCKGSDDEGLRLILTNLDYSNTNVVVKPIFLLTHHQTLNKPPDDHNNVSFDCYLKSCHLCHKSLSLDKEIYMYRGDLGFCSVECRERQIYVDETKELEISTKKILSSFRQRNRRDGRCETRQLLEDFRKRRHHPFSPQRDRVIFL